MTASLAPLHALFRTAAASLEPSDIAGPPDAATVRAWLTLYYLRAKPHYLDAAIQAVEAVEARGTLPADPAGWLLACCRGWVLRAAPSFRRLASPLANALPPEAASCLPWLELWRINGRKQWRDAALSAVPATTAPGNRETLEAWWAAHRATADESFRDAATAVLSAPPGEVDPLLWPIQADLLDREGADYVNCIDSLEHHTPAERLTVAAALGLPRLRLEISWWLAAELEEGPVSEAITLPYPTLQVRFHKLPRRDQVRFQPILGGVAHEPIIDVGVAGAALSHLLAEVDKTPFLAGGRSRRSLGRRR